ncbi:MAG: DUF4149 domain-containing protein [Byssovorax sp.]
MNEERFTEDDLRPSDEERAAALRDKIDRAAAIVAVLATGVWIGGMIALGACAAPFVFEIVPGPLSGYAMGSAFARFDKIALGASVLVLAAEVARTWAAGTAGRRPAARIRRILAIVMAMGAAYTGLTITPQINGLYRDGARRGDGDAGVHLDRIHKRAELIGKAVTAGGVALVTLHMLTLGARKPDDDDTEYLAPLPPGPR